MKKSFPRFFALTASVSVLLVVLPPSYAMDMMERIVTTQTQSIRREASEYQRKVAEANARAYMTTQLKAQRHASTATPTPKPGKTGKTADTKTAPHKNDDAQDLKAAKKKLPRYVAVDTVTDKRSAPGTKKAVMVWDTQSETLVGNSVYDVANVPTLGSTAKFETYSAQYVGNGM